jgi:hypothetical protein
LRDSVLGIDVELTNDLPVGAYEQLAELIRMRAGRLRYDPLERAWIYVDPAEPER